MDKCCYEKGMRRLKDKKELTRGEKMCITLLCHLEMACGSLRGA